MRTLLPLALFGALASAQASECAPPPVVSAEQAICLATEFVEPPKPTWELIYQAKEQANKWLVSYSPTSSYVRGGAGEIQVIKSSGKVFLIKAQR